MGAALLAGVDPPADRNTIRNNRGPGVYSSSNTLTVSFDYNVITGNNPDPAP